MLESKLLSVAVATCQNQIILLWNFILNFNTNKFLQFLKAPNTNFLLAHAIIVFLDSQPKHM